MITSDNIPFYARVSLISVGMFAFITMLYVLQSIIVPLVYATIIAIVLSPCVNFLVRKKMNRIIAITIVLIITIATTLSIITLLLSQADLVSESFPALMAKFDQLIRNTESWVAVKFNIRLHKVHTWFAETKTSIFIEGKSLIGQTLVNIGSIMIVLVLIPVYVFLILLYQQQLIEFIHRIFSVNKHVTVNKVLTSTKGIIQSYLVGLLLEAFIVAALNVGSLLALGIDYAILLGVIGAVLNVVPYIGGIVAVTLPMLIALATKSPTHALLVLGAYIFIQFVDNNFIIPKVVASKVKLNALVSIVIVLAGGALWGLPGMFLSIPLTAILKVIFDHIDIMKPWGYLLGNIEPTASKFAFIKKSVNNNI